MVFSINYSNNHDIDEILARIDTNFTIIMMLLQIDEKL